MISCVMASSLLFCGWKGTNCCDVFGGEKDEADCTEVLLDDGSGRVGREDARLRGEGVSLFVLQLACTKLLCVMD